MSGWFDEQWTVSLGDPTDPHLHVAAATRVPGTVQWRVVYHRGGELVADATVSTPAPHAPPLASMRSYLRDLRRLADFEAANPAPVGDT